MYLPDKLWVIFALLKRTKRESANFWKTFLERESSLMGARIAQRAMEQAKGMSYVLMDLEGWAREVDI